MSGHLSAVEAVGHEEQAEYFLNVDPAHDNAERLAAIAQAHATLAVSYRLAQLAEILGT